MLGGEVEESNQALPVGSKRLDRPGVLGLVLRFETRSCSLAVGAARGVHHLLERALGAGLKPSGQLVEYVGELVTPAGLLAGLGPDLARRSPEPQRAVAHRHHRRGQPAPLELAQQRLPALGALPVAVLDREQLLLAVGPRADQTPCILSPSRR